tara:strand:+ start:774 stop:923 length:150 start_codon:yes stop_codon:yes gene_type:complete
MNWTEILRNGGVSDSPGYQETVASFVERPYKKPNRKAKPPKSKTKKKAK